MEQAAALDWAHLQAPAYDVVRGSCSAFLQSNPHVQIDEAALQAYVDALDHTQLKEFSQKQYPLSFPTPRSEINFLCTLALLQIGSGWRRALHASSGRGAAETMTFGCMGMHISGEITADAMVRVGTYDVAQLFGLKIEEEVEIMPAVRTERKTPLFSLAEAIRRVLNDSGATLRKLGHADFADFFLKEATQKDAEGRPMASELLAKLVRHFSALQDAYVLPVEGKKEGEEKAEGEEKESSSSSSSTPQQARVVYLLKKAQLMVSDVQMRFAKEDPAHFDYGDITKLTVFSDNVLPAVLRAKGILKYSEELAKKVDNNEELCAVESVREREQEASIRAAAVVACDRIVNMYNEKYASKQRAAEDASSASSAPALTAQTLDYHLWLAGKEPELRKLARHATKSMYY